METGRKRNLQEDEESVSSGTEAKKRLMITRRATSTVTLKDASTSITSLPLTRGRSAPSVKTGTEPKKLQRVAKKAATAAIAQDASTRRRTLPLAKGRPVSTVVTATDPTIQKRELRTSKNGKTSTTVRASSRNLPGVPPASRSTMASSVVAGPTTQKKECYKKDATVQDASSRAEVPPSRAPPIAVKCSICLDTTRRKGMRRLLCDHEFHKACVDEWLRRNNTCPVCRKVLAPPLPVLEGINQNGLEFLALFLQTFTYVNSV